MVAVDAPGKLGSEVAMDYTKAVVWEKAMRLAAGVVTASACLPPWERFGIRSQLTRAAISVPSNIAEGWARDARREKVQFLSIAHGSLAELHTQLILCERLGWLSEAQTAEPFALADEVGRMLTTLRRRWGPARSRLPKSLRAPP